MAKSKLSIYLIKRQYSDGDNVVDEEKCDEVFSLDSSKRVYVRKSTLHTPSWVQVFFQGKVSEEPFKSSSSSALMLIDVQVSETEERLFALSFGFGFTLLNKDSIEERFGLRVALNSGGSTSLRKLKRTTVAGNARKTSEQMPRRSAISDFEMDIERDLLEGVTVTGEKGDLLEGSITGSDLLSISANVDVSNVSDFLKQVYQRYLSDSYKESFSWVDQIVPVKAPAVIEALEAKAISLLNDKDSQLWFAVPEVINWETVRGFQIGRQPELAQDILIDDVLGALEPKSLEEFDQLKKVGIFVIGEETGEPMYRCRASDCLYGEFALEGDQFCANGGRWYRIDKDFQNTIESRYSKAIVSSMSFPECYGERESEYNRKLADLDPGRFALMDAKSIRAGSGHSSVELCDVLARDGVFIHVKKYSGSSALSHLFNQGLVSAQLVVADRTFRKNALERLHKEAPDFKPDNSDLEVKEVVFAIISKERDKLPTIPFFSKVTFDYVSTQLRLMGVQVSVKAVRNVK